MRPFATTTYLFIGINILLFIGLICLTQKISKMDKAMNNKMKPHLRMSNHFEIPVAADEYVKPEPSFTVVLVTHKEVLLEKTVLNILEQTSANRLKEVLIIDDANDPPITWNPDPSRVRIVRSDERLGLIRARILGGNEAAGEMIAFLDAHCRVNSNWLETPHRLIMENNRTIVNFVDFILNEDFTVKEAGNGIGSSATIYKSLRQFWGGGSRMDDYTPITMGMFAISKYWWNMGQMDPALQIWGGENVEISFRTWLCGGRIMVARDSYVAHYFRTKPSYTYDTSVVTKNYIRIAHTWLDEPSLREFYKEHRLVYEPGKIHPYAGDISDRLRLKEELNCKPFNTYLEMFQGRTFCPSGKSDCGRSYSVIPSDIKESAASIFKV